MLSGFYPKVLQAKTEKQASEGFSRVEAPQKNHRLKKSTEAYFHVKGCYQAKAGYWEDGKVQGSLGIQVE